MADLAVRAVALSHCSQGAGDNRSRVTHAGLGKAWPAWLFTGRQAGRYAGMDVRGGNRFNHVSRAGRQERQGERGGREGRGGRQGGEGEGGGGGGGGGERGDGGGGGGGGGEGGGEETRRNGERQKEK